MHETDRSIVLKVSAITHSFGDAPQPVLTHASCLNTPPHLPLAFLHTFIDVYYIYIYIYPNALQGIAVVKQDKQDTEQLHAKFIAALKL